MLAQLALIIPTITFWPVLAFAVGVRKDGSPFRKDWWTS